MKRWLVVRDPDSGIAQLLNVRIVEAEDSRAARLKACDAEPCIRDAIHTFHAYELDALPDGWGYFT